MYRVPLDAGHATMDGDDVAEACVVLVPFIDVEVDERLLELLVDVALELGRRDVVDAMLDVGTLVVLDTGVVELDELLSLMVVDAMLDVEVDDLFADEVNWERLNLSPAPQNSEAFPGQVNEQSELGACILPPMRLSPQ